MSHGYFATIEIKSNLDRRLDSSAKIIETISSFISENRLHIIGSLKEAQAEIAPHAAILSAIETAAIGSVERMNQFHRDWAEQVDSLRLKLEENFEEKRRKLDVEFEAKNSALLADIHVKNETLAQKEVELEERRRQLDDRDYMHVRRDAFTKIITTVQDRIKNFQVSTNTSRSRWPIHATFVLLLLTIGTAAGWSLYTWGARGSDS